MSLAVRLGGITKSFGALRALDKVGLEVRSGTIHALVGENGAGKTTLMRVLYGSIEPDAGVIEVDGQRRYWRNSADAIAHGIGMVSQHYSVIPQLTCLQNLVLGAEGAQLMPLSSLRERANVIATSMGFTFDWGAPASTLSPAAAQKLEITRLLWRSSRIMILDEPTAMLSPQDADALYTSLRQLAKGGATVIVVTHRIGEVLQHCDRATVLRDGKNVAEIDPRQIDASSLAALIVGHQIDQSERPVSPRGGSLLTVENLSVLRDRGDEAVKGASFQLNVGEIVGLAGVDGNGQRELVQALVGTRAVASGHLRMAGIDVTDFKTSERIACGFRLIPEDRHAEGMVEDWSLADNAALGLQRMAPLQKGGVIDFESRESLATRVADRFDTRYSHLDQPMHSLSGGNQQRFVAARAFELDPRLVIAFQPSRGLDVEAGRRVYNAMRTLCREGASAFVVSFDLDELLEHCDRVLVVFDGQIRDPQTLDRQAIGRLMVGAG